MRDLLVWGVGELGKLYGSGALAAGFRVTPILRTSDVPITLAGRSPDTPILIAVSEQGLPDVLDSVPRAQKGQVILLQNELFPSLWATEAEAPTVMIPWLLKKKGDPQIVIRETPVYGVHSEVVKAMHEALGLPCATLDSASALASELADKYAFILTINALGVVRDRTLGGWLREEPVRVRDLASEACQLAARLAETPLDEARRIQRVLQGMHALSALSARGRSAGARVTRAQAHARALGLDLPLLFQISA